MRQRSARITRIILGRTSSFTPTPLFEFESLHSSPIHLTRRTPSTTSTRWTRSSARFASTTTSPSSSPLRLDAMFLRAHRWKVSAPQVEPILRPPSPTPPSSCPPTPKALPEEAQSEVDPLFLAPCPYGCLGEGNCHNKVDTARSCFYGTLNRASLSPCSTASTNIASSASLFVPSVKTCLQPSRDCGSYLR
jgi:hypothetical protein